MDRELTPFTADAAADHPWAGAAPRIGGPVQRFADPKWYLGIARRWWWLIAVMAILFAVSTASTNRKAPYVATTTLQIDRPTPRSFGFAVQAVADVGKDRALLTSASMAVRVIDELRLYEDPSFTAAPPGLVASALQWVGLPYEAMAGYFDAEPKGIDLPEGDARAWGLVRRYLAGLSIDGRDSPLAIRYRHPNRAMAVEISRTHAREYIRRSIENSADTTSRAGLFLDAQLGTLKGRVEESERTLTEFRRAHRELAVTGADNENVVLERLSTLNTQYAAAKAQRIGLEAEYEHVKRRDYASIPSVQRDPTYNRLREERETLRSRYAAMGQVYQPKYWKMEALEGEIEELDERIQEHVRLGVRAVESSYLAAKEREEALALEVAKERDAVLDLNDLTVEFAMLKRESDTARSLYDSVLQQARKNEIAESVNMTNVSILDEARLDNPLSVRRAMSSTWNSAMLGAAFGFAIGLVIACLDTTIRTPDELRASFDLGTLTVVPRFREGLPAPSGSATKSPPEPSFLPALVAATAEESVPLEAYRTLRTALLLSDVDSPPRVMLVTSATSAEGKTITSLNTAFALARSGARVLIVDADLRRPHAHEVLGMERSPGLADFLGGQVTFERALQKVAMPSSFGAVPRSPDVDLAATGGDLGVGCVVFLAAGTRVPNPAELLGSRRMKGMLEGLSEIYDYVVVDSAPVLPVADTLPLASAVDGVVLVVRGQATTRKAISLTLERLHSAKAKILGTVLNGVDLESSDYYSTGGYYTSYVSGAGQASRGWEQGDVRSA